MRAALDSARLKMGWAQQHLKVFERQIVRFVNSEPYTLTFQENPKGTEHPYQRVVHFHVRRPFPPWWPLLIGDILQNLRAVLDHLLWGLTVQHKGAEFAESHARQLTFPISPSQEAFDSHGGLIGVSDEVRAAIRDLQPYVSQPNAPTSDALWYLRELSNVDKHRLVHLIFVMMEEGVIRWEPAVLGAMWVHQGAIEDGAKIVELTIPSLPADAKVQMEMELAVGISLQETAKTAPVPVGVALRTITPAVQKALDALAPHYHGSP